MDSAESIQKVEYVLPSNINVPPKEDPTLLTSMFYPNQVFTDKCDCPPEWGSKPVGGKNHI